MAICAYGMSSSLALISEPVYLHGDILGSGIGMGGRLENLDSASAHNSSWLTPTAHTHTNTHTNTYKHMYVLNTHSKSIIHTIIAGILFQQRVPSLSPPPTPSLFEILQQVNSFHLLKVLILTCNMESAVDKTHGALNKN